MKPNSKKPSPSNSIGEMESSDNKSMACSYVPDVNSINSAMRIDATATTTSSLELQQRRMLLHSRNDEHSHSHSHLHSADSSDSPILQNYHCKTIPPPLDVVVKKEREDYDLQVTCCTVQTDSSGVEYAIDSTSSLPQYSIVCDVPTATKVEDSCIENGRKTSLESYFPAPELKQEISEDNIDDLDHIVLKERQRMLLARRLPGLSNQAVKSGSGGLLENLRKHTVEKVKEESYSADGTTKAATDQCHDLPGVSKTSLFDLPLVTTGLEEHDTSKSGGMISQFASHEEQGDMPAKNDGPSSSTCPTSVKVKDEPWDNSEFQNVDKDVIGGIPINLPIIKSEWEVHEDFLDDQLEHMSLVDRLNFLMSGEGSSLNISTSYSSLKMTGLSSFTSPIVSESQEDHLSIKRLRKRKKTATDSVQTALEEDAPGLLQVLLNKGVVVDEIKLYSEAEDVEALDESLCDDSFSELEAVFSKVFSQRHSFIKFPIVRAAKASRANYCLACLISLVEQTRYLQFREWPVEWGWCRELQSFIFVFERHNRIVLERPEYGYATYFFELVQSFPVEWQIKRLVIVMKLTTCSRITLIENKELVVGEDLSEGEAKVLMEYGWKPNSGLGTMLNYCDRVVHDRKNENDSSEWRSKIGKLLMDGYNGGTIITPDIPKKVVEYIGAQGPNIKLEESDL